MTLNWEKSIKENRPAEESNSTQEADEEQKKKKKSHTERVCVSVKN